MEDKRSYYAIIPAIIRYDDAITPNAKLLYGEITALCNEKGYCWATNEYFSELYSVSKKSISIWINQLIRAGYISSEIVYKEGSKEILYRYLRIIEHPIEENVNTYGRNLPYPIEENFYTYGRNLGYPMEEKVKDNNTSNNTDNNTSNSTYEGSAKRTRFKKPTIDEISDYISENNYKVDAEMFYDYYESNGWMAGKNHMKDWKATVRNWERRDRNKKPSAYPERKSINWAEI